jgi:predicted nucleic acid-binding protein
MIVAYAVFNVQPFLPDVDAVLKRAASDVAVPESFLAEFVNVAWLYTRKSGISLATAEAALNDALQYVNRRVRIDDLWHDALRLAVSVGHSPYDTLFVALAEREATRLVTYDSKLLTAFPAVAISPADYLASP